MAVACALLLGLSWLISVGPALGAGNNSNGNNSNSSGANGNGNGTSGNVKVHDAATGLETSGTDNEPHVCDFWLGFTFDAPFEAGTWVVVSWAPTGDGSTVASGAYNTGGDGVDSSSVIEVTAGHYRVEWAATGATSSKKKTFWVDAGCNETPAEEPPAEEPAPPAEDPGTPSEEPPTEEPAPPAEEPAPPAEDPGTPPEEPPSEEPAPPLEEAIQLVEGQLTVPSEESDDEEPAAPVEEPAVVEPAVEEPAVVEPAVEEPAVVEPAVEEPAVAPSVESPATPADELSEEDPAQAEDPGATETGAPPAQGELGSVAGVGEPTMSDTATATLAAPSGLLATIGMLLVIAVHAIARRRPFGRDGMATDA